MNTPTYQTSDISKISIQLLLKEPFYGHFLMGIPKEFSEEIDTAAVRLMENQLIKLMINEGFWNSLLDDQRYGLLKHEILHIVLKHLNRQKSFSNKLLFNIAADLVVNQYILPTQLPEGALLVERFWHLEKEANIVIEKDREVDYYYDLLNKFLKNSFINLQTEYNDKKLPPIDLDELMKQGHTQLKKHKYWQEFDKLSPGEEKVLEHQIRNVTKHALERVKFKNYGNLPTGLISKLEELIEVGDAQVDWRRVIRLFASSSSSTFLKNTIRRPSKRYGTTPGIQIKRRHKLIVAIDTSGSISENELKTFMQEIYHIWRKGAQIEIVECDAAIHHRYYFTGHFPTTIHGRGGTNFDPVIQLSNELKPDALIYFTDGYAPKPIKPTIPALWVLTSNGNNKNELPGRKININV